MAAPVSNINRLAKAGAPIPFQSTVLALRSLVGEPGNADIQHKMGNLFRHFDIVAAHQEQDPSSLLRMPPLKEGVNMGTVHLMLSRLIEAATTATPDAGPHDEDVVLYTVQRLIIPVLERMGHIEKMAVILSNEERARAVSHDFLTEGRELQITELTRITYVQAMDPVDTKVGRLPGDMSVGLRKACVQGAKELTALEPELATAIKNRVPLPAKFNASALATKYTRHILLRMVAPVVAHRLKNCALFCSVISVHDVLLANDARAPIVIVIEEKKDDKDFKGKRERKD